MSFSAFIVGSSSLLCFANVNDYCFSNIKTMTLPNAINLTNYSVYCLDFFAMVVANSVDAEMLVLDEWRLGRSRKGCLLNFHCT